jgi:DNA-directed RNA polymerase subunit omega
MSRYFPLNSAEIVDKTDKLMNAAPNRYRIVVQVARRAKRRRFEDMEGIDIPMIKPVLRAVLEMSDELTQPEILRDEEMN